MQQSREAEDMRFAIASGHLVNYSGDDLEPKKKKYKKDAYFSDEEELADDWKGPNKIMFVHINTWNWQSSCMHHEVEIQTTLFILISNHNT